MRLAAPNSSGAYVRRTGRVTRLTGTTVFAKMQDCFVGELCLIRDPFTEEGVYAEVVGLDEGQAVLTLLDSARGVSSNAEVVGLGKPAEILIGDHILGRVIDPLGEPLDGLPPWEGAVSMPLIRKPPNPMKRNPIDKIAATGLRVFDGLLTIGVGQRIGLFGSAGTGKSTLIVELLRHAEADVVVLGLVGERGREVREFVEHVRQSGSLERCCLVVSTSDSPAQERLRAADTATTIAEYFRDQGKNVILIVDSVTRVARALREVGLAAGEPPTRRGFPPSVFSALPQLVERAGNSDKGSITAFYTILVEGESDQQDPVADELRGLLDAHVILSRDIAAQGNYPAVDVEVSVSRLMNSIVTDEQKRLASAFRSQLKALRDVDLLIKVGEYRSGADPLVDLAMKNRKKLETFLYPGSLEATPYDKMLEMLREAVE